MKTNAEIKSVQFLLASSMILVIPFVYIDNFMSINVSTFLSIHSGTQIFKLRQSSPTAGTGTSCMCSCWVNSYTALDPHHCLFSGSSLSMSLSLEPSRPFMLVRVKRIIN